MASRALDVVGSALLLIAGAPVLLAAAAGVRLSSRGPVFFRATRVGRDGVPFVMHKFRTMHANQGTGASVITGTGDRRVFWFGRILRKAKIDELPQLYDVLRGKMSMVGPRPEDPKIVDQHYTAEYRETLSVRPGLASPGSIYNYTHGEQFLTGADPEAAYVRSLLPVKMALDRVYVRRASLLYDLRLLARTTWVIATILCGRRSFVDPPELRTAHDLGLLPRDPEKNAAAVG